MDGSWYFRNRERCNMLGLGNINYPCKGCDKREVGCHSTCTEYNEIKERAKVEKELAKNDCMEKNYTYPCWNTTMSRNKGKRR